MVRGIEKLDRRKVFEKRFEEDTGWTVVEKDGHLRKARPEEVPRPLVEGEGASLENGVPISFVPDEELRKREKRK